MAPTWLQKGANMATKWALEASWRDLGGILEPLKRSGRPAKGGLPGAYGALLDASLGALGAEKRSLEQLLAAPRGIPKEFSIILGAKKLPKGRPRGSKIESKRQLELKTRFLQNTLFST